MYKKSILFIWYYLSVSIFPKKQNRKKDRVYKTETL